MTQAELDALVSCIAAHANGENQNQKDHIQEFNDPQRKAPLGIRSREEFEQHIKETLLNQETVGFSKPNGQEFYYNRDTNTVVLLDGKGSGTAFRPDKRGDYLQRKNFLQERQIGVELSLKEGGILPHHPELAHEKIIHKTAEPEKAMTWYEVQQKRAALHTPATAPVPSPAPKQAPAPAAAPTTSPKPAQTPQPARPLSPAEPPERKKTPEESLLESLRKQEQEREEAKRQHKGRGRSPMDDLLSSHFNRKSKR